MIAHVGGAPVEETLLPLMSGAGTGLLLARAWVMSRLRRRRNPRDYRQQDAADLIRAGSSP